MQRLLLTGTVEVAIVLETTEEPEATTSQEPTQSDEATTPATIPQATTDIQQVATIPQQATILPQQLTTITQQLETTIQQVTNPGDTPAVNIIPDLDTGVVEDLPPANIETASRTTQLSDDVTTADLSHANLLASGKRMPCTKQTKNLLDDFL